MDKSYFLDYQDEQEIKELLLYRKVSKINDDTLLLDKFTFQSGDIQI